MLDETGFGSAVPFARSVHHYRTKSGIILATVFTLITAAICYFTLEKVQKEPLPLVILWVLLIIGVISSWLQIWRSAWLTSPNGLTKIGVFGTRTWAWSEVTDYFIHRPKDKAPVYFVELQGKRKSINRMVSDFQQLIDTVQASATNSASKQWTER